MPVLTVLQKYWREILFAVILVGMSAFWYFDRVSLIKAMDAAIERHEQELTIINESHEREEARKKQLLEEYRKIIDGLQEDFDRRERELERLRDKRTGELERLRMENPKELARQIEEQFGFSYVELVWFRLGFDLMEFACPRCRFRKFYFFTKGWRLTV